MNDDARALRTLAIVLVLSGAARVGWQSRAGTGVDAGAAVAVELLADSADRVAAEEERRSTPLGPEERIDPNTAPEAELDRIPGIGPALAARWVAHRAEVGGFSAAEELLGIPGVGPSTLARITPVLAPRPWGRVEDRPGGESGAGAGGGRTRRGVRW